MTNIKPLGGKAYGSIPHLPGSKFGNRDDKGIDIKTANYFLRNPGKKNLILVTEKLDGTCVSVAKIDGEIIPLIRAGYKAETSRWVQHHLFAQWVCENKGKFEYLKNNERICGEWLAMAHGTIYDLDGRDPFVPFDLFSGLTRKPYQDLIDYCDDNGLSYAPLLYYGYEHGCDIETALKHLGDHGYYGAVDIAEGCVWRWERSNGIIGMAKYVRPEKEIGKYLEGVTGNDPIWNINI